MSTDFADVHLDVDDWTATFHIGLQLRVSDRLSIGARYLHTADLDLTGTADFRQIPTGIALEAGNPLGLPAGTPLDGVLAPQFAPEGALSDQPLTSALKLPNQGVTSIGRYSTSRTRPPTRCFSSSGTRTRCASPSMRWRASGSRCAAVSCTTMRRRPTSR